MKPALTLLLFVTAVCLNLAHVDAEEDAATKARASLDNYFQAWGEPDTGKREALLATAWADDATYTDPTVHLEGRAALVEHIEGFVTSPQSSKFSIEQASDIDFHHNSFRFYWEMRDNKGNVLTPGFDYGEFNDDGQITKIVGFFGPVPKLK